MSKLSANSIFKSTLIALLFLLALNSPKFLGLDHSPPGFYGDEVAGATQTLCLLEDAHDFQGNKLPLFAEGFPGAGQYTPIYLYGEPAFARSWVWLHALPFFFSIYGQKIRGALNLPFMWHLQLASCHGLFNSLALPGIPP